MTNFPLHTPETAPEDTLPLFENSQKAFGMIPNLHAVMGASPSLLEAYQVVHGLFMKTSLSADEQTVIWQTINVEHECHYCVPAHTAVANMMGVDKQISDALRDNTPLPEKLEALRDFTLKMLLKRGQVSEADVTEFLAAGYNQQNILEVILGLSQKVMSNYVNHVAGTPLDAPFQVFDWSPSKA
ncbi:MAG: carboxymuconolactone decarboxylase [Alphaproteobacteria bacterium]|nr:MAG: carboxymuconolactone decarboxylase [Alphaproteobacteria bacterium]